MRKELQASLFSKVKGCPLLGSRLQGVHGSLHLTCSLFLFLDIFGNVPVSNMYKNVGLMGGVEF